MTPEQGKVVVTHLMEKINGNADKIIRLDEEQVDGADVVVVSYGITSRIAVKAIQDARAEGIKVGSLRPHHHLAVLRETYPRTGWQGEGYRGAGNQLRQMVLEVERCSAGQCKVISVNHCGGAVHDPEVILDAIRKANQWPLISENSKMTAPCPARSAWIGCRTSGAQVAASVPR